MLTKIAQSMSSFFIRSNTISAEDRVVYDYCFEILLSTILNLALIAVIAIFNKALLLTSELQQRTGLPVFQLGVQKDMCDLFMHIIDQLS